MIMIKLIIDLDVRVNKNKDKKWKTFVLTNLSKTDRLDLSINQMIIYLLITNFTDYQLAKFHGQN